MTDRKRVIILGTGIAGMTAAYLLNRAYDILVFEQAGYIGGHTNTVDVREDGVVIPVDTGFIVCNPLAYPGLMRLFAEIGVPTQESCMSFSISDRVTGLEFGSRTVNNTFAQRQNFLRPDFWKFIQDFFRWSREGAAAIDDPRYSDYTLGEYMREKGYSDLFARKFLIPATSAIWSTPYKFSFEYPVQALFRFYKNHGLLGGKRAKWRSVVGGSQAYVPKLTRTYRDRIFLNNGAVAVRRTPDGVMVRLADGSECEADHVVFATHSDQALALLTDATRAEQDILGSIRYLANEVYFHTDERLMPRNRRAWESWNYLIYADLKQHQDQPVTLTYWMNLLQNLGALGARKNYLVTVNPQEPPHPDKIIATYTYHHPQYDFAALKAQARIPEINGAAQTHFCGAWCRYGFHEDGMQSGVTVANNLGVTW